MDTIPTRAGAQNFIGNFNLRAQKFATRAHTGVEREDGELAVWMNGVETRGRECTATLIFGHYKVLCISGLRKRGGEGRRMLPGFSMRSVEGVSRPPASARQRLRNLSEKIILIPM
jgi:hypothetical protein